MEVNILKTEIAQPTGFHQSASGGVALVGRAMIIVLVAIAITASFRALSPRMNRCSLMRTLKRDLEPWLIAKIVQDRDGKPCASEYRSQNTRHK
jgi:hypothetical protein